MKFRILVELEFPEPLPDDAGPDVAEFVADRMRGPGGLKSSVSVRVVLLTDATQEVKGRER